MQGEGEEAQRRSEKPPLEQLYRTQEKTNPFVFVASRVTKIQNAKRKKLQLG